MRRTIFTLIMLCIATLTLQAQDVWTAAGSSTLFGSHWDETDTRNDLIDKGNGIWELTKTDCILEKNVKYELKVLKNHNWAESYPQTNANYVFMVEETGTYNVTIQFNETNYEVGVITKKTGDAVIGEKTWTVAGFGTILGVEWDPEATENDMIKQEDNVTYILTKTNLTIAQGGYKYKIRSVQTTVGLKTMVMILTQKVMPPFISQQTESTTLLSPSTQRPTRFPAL